MLLTQVSQRAIGTAGEFRSRAWTEPSAPRRGGCRTGRQRRRTRGGRHRLPGAGLIRSPARRAPLLHQVMAQQGTCSMVDPDQTPSGSGRPADRLRGLLAAHRLITTDRRAAPSTLERTVATACRAGRRPGTPPSPSATSTARCEHVRSHRHRRRDGPPRVAEPTSPSVSRPAATRSWCRCPGRRRRPRAELYLGAPAAGRVRAATTRRWPARWPSSPAPSCATPGSTTRPSAATRGCRPRARSPAACCPTPTSTSCSRSSPAR